MSPRPVLLFELARDRPRTGSSSAAGSGGLAGVMDMPNPKKDAAAPARFANDEVRGGGDEDVEPGRGDFGLDANENAERAEGSAAIVAEEDDVEIGLVLVKVRLNAFGEVRAVVVVESFSGVLETDPPHHPPFRVTGSEGTD